MSSGKTRNRETAKTRSTTARKAGAKRASADGAQAHIELARQLAEIVAAHSLSEIAYETEALSLVLRRGSEVPAAGAMVHAAPILHAAPLSAALPVTAPSAVTPAPGPAEPETNAHTVTSPFVGTFYRAPNPDSPPYVDVGQRVEKGQILCIVEAMKLMNEIEADAAGVVTAVLVQNAQPVEYGQPLFEISPA